MERFIRQKYEFRAFSGGNARQAARQNTGSASTSSQEDQPPPLPPKPGKRFGFSLRSASATYSRPRMDKFTPPLSPALSGSDGRETTPPKMMNKASRVFGSAVGNQEDNFDEKLAALREMGFSDARRNSIVLKSMNGNLDRAVETLVRMGDSSKAPARALTPVSATDTISNGLNVERKRAAEPQPAKQPSTNPWEALDEPPKRAFTMPLPQIPQQEAFQQPQPQQQATSYNPFLQASGQNQPPPQALQDSFQGLQISNAYPQQAYQQSTSPSPMMGQNPFMAPNQFSQPQGTAYPTSNNPYTQPAQSMQPAQAEQQPSNPFLRHTKSQTFTPSNPWAQPSAFATNNQNPWLSQSQVNQAPQATSPAPMYQGASDFFGTQPIQSQQQQQQMTQPPPQPPMNYPPQQNGSNPFYAQSQLPTSASYNPYMSQQVQPQQFQQPQQPQQPQQTTFQQMLPQQTRYDKTSIMALYNYPQSAGPQALGALPEDSVPATSIYGMNGGGQVQRSVTMPVSTAGNMNPFAQGPPAQTNGMRHVSQESRDFVGLGGSGRHSPDAFSGLSARYAH